MKANTGPFCTQGVGRLHGSHPREVALGGDAFAPAGSSTQNPGPQSPLGSGWASERLEAGN